jgi:hypothetical protein
MRDFANFRLDNTAGHWLVDCCAIVKYVDVVTCIVAKGRSCTESVDLAFAALGFLDWRAEGFRSRGPFIVGAVGEIAIAAPTRVLHFA